MLTITKQSEIQEYYNSSALSQSVLKTLIKGMDNYLYEKDKPESKLYYQESESMLIGSAVDCILTGEEGRFEEQYHVSNVQNKPSDTIMSIVKRVYDLGLMDTEESEFKTKKLTDFKGFILQAVNEHKYYPNWGDDTRINKVAENYEYFEDLIAGVGKQVLSQDEKNTVDKIVHSLRTNPRTAKYFDRQAQAENQNIEFCYQFPIYFTYRGVKCKCLIDLFLIFRDVKGAIIKVQGVDLKTFYGKPIDFISALQKRRYDIQGAWYNEGIQEYLNSLGYERITPEPFQFVVESSTKQGNPLIFKMSDSLTHLGKYGRKEVKLIDTNFFSSSRSEDILIKKSIPGFNDLITEYLYHEEKGWVEEKIVADNNGVLEINWDWYYK